MEIHELPECARAAKEMLKVFERGKRCASRERKAFARDECGAVRVRVESLYDAAMPSSPREIWRERFYAHFSESFAAPMRAAECRDARIIFSIMKFYCWCHEWQFSAARAWARKRWGEECAPREEHAAKRVRVMGGMEGFSAQPSCLCRLLPLPKQRPVLISDREVG